MVRDIIDDRTVWLTHAISKLPILVDPVTHGKTSKKRLQTHARHMSCMSRQNLGCDSFHFSIWPKSITPEN